MKWLDTHCHLYAAEFDEDRQAMVQRAIDDGVHQMMLPNIDMDSIDGMMALCKSFPAHCFPMMGLHPTSVKPGFEKVLAQLEEYFLRDDMIGVGETGIDLYWDTTYRDEQIVSFEQHLEWGRKYGLPVIIHSRESLDLNIEIVSKHQDGSLTGIFHCFTGTSMQAMRIAELGFFMGIGGVITYKNSDLREVIREIPVERIVLETDAPYLAPVPYRGKRNESSYLVHTAQVLAQSLGLTMEETAKLTTDNASEVFRKKA